MGTASMDANQPYSTRRTRGGEEEEEVDGVRSEKVYSTAISRKFDHIGVTIYSSML